MSTTQAAAQLEPAARGTPEVSSGILQRTCACGKHVDGGGECAECRKKRLQRQGGRGEAKIQRSARTHVHAPAPGFAHEFTHVPARSPARKLLQRGVSVSQPGDRAEVEADQIADQVMRAPADVAPHAVAPASDTAGHHASGDGAPLSSSVNAFMAPRFGADFSPVRVHTGSEAAEMNQALDARAFAFGSDIYFGSGEYRPGTAAGDHLIAHELTHVVQQGGAGAARDTSVAPAVEGGTQIQRTLGDGHDLTSTRFSRILDLEAAFDDETLIRRGSTGRAVQAIQRALYDLGFPLPVGGADGDFGPETESAVEAFQTANPPLAVDGIVGDDTMQALDTRFAGSPTLPPAATLSAPWTESCLRDVICPWSPHTIDTLTGITLKSFDSISFADEEWNGTSWTPAPFPGGGFNTGTEIGVLNSSCEEMAETIYHEVLHANQPTSQTTTQATEAYAYRIGEEFSIAMGFAGRPGLRKTDAQGREFASRSKIDAFVASEYPSVSASAPGEEIIGKGSTLGDVEVRRPDGTVYTRPAAVGEKVPGPMTTTNEVTHATSGWTCP